MNNPLYKKFIRGFIILIIFTTFINAQNVNDPLKLDTKTKIQTVNKIAKILKENYIFPETAKKMDVFIKSQLKSGAYDSIDDPGKFAVTLTADLQSISKDKHLQVWFNPEEAKRMMESQKNGRDSDQEKRWNGQMKKENYGFKKVEHLSGNIGYVDFRNFASPEYSKETVASVMGFLANSDAIIFDLRMNGGGDPEGVRLICSYLFGDAPVHLNDLYFRPSDKTVEYWTLRKVDGKKMPDVPVYVLTSSYTFSGAEEFAYNLKNLKRAVIVGETTGGGAHPGDDEPVNSSFVMNVPSGRAINPITKTNWEGTGVTPDIPVKSEKALEMAEILALQKLAEKTKDNVQKRSFLWMIESLQASIDPPAMDDDVMKNYAGTYGERAITFEGGKLFYQRKGRQKFQMTPISGDTFMFKEIDYFRIRIDKDSDGKIKGVTGLYDNGTTDYSPKTE